MICETHPGYEGAAKPRTLCETCWDGWLEAKGADRYQLEDLDRQAARDEIGRLKAANKRLKREALENETLARIAEGVRRRAVRPSWDSRKRTARGKAPAFALIDVSDEHYGEVVKPEQVRGLNAYDPEIAAKRIRAVYENAIRLALDYTSGIEYVGACVVLGGDHTSGEIHEELGRTNAATPIEAMIPLRDLHVTGLRAVREAFPCLRVVRTAGGNHGRTDKRMPAKDQAARNFDALLYDLILEQFTGVKGVEWNDGRGDIASFRLFGTHFDAVHGHQFRGGSGIAGMLSPLLLGKHRMAQSASSAGLPHEWLLVHHWHSLFLGGYGVMVNGTVKGYDEFCQSRNFPYRPPEQLFAVTDREHGVTLRAPVRCG